MIWEARKISKNRCFRIFLLTCIIAMFLTYWYYFIKMTQMNYQLNYLAEAPKIDCNSFLTQKNDDEITLLAHYEYQALTKQYADGMWNSLSSK